MIGITSLESQVLQLFLQLQMPFPILVLAHRAPCVVEMELHIGLAWNGVYFFASQ